MSKVQIEIPDDGWFRGELDFRPQDKQLCVVVFKIIKFPCICLFYEKDCMFLDVQSIKIQNSQIDKCEIISYSTMNWDGVDRWKPIGLPADVNERVLSEIEKWFEEDDDD